MYNCNLGLHDFDKWGEPFKLYQHDGGSYLYQRRICKICGLAQQRMVFT